MPKKSRRHKNLDTGSRPGAHSGTNVSGIKDLLARQPVLQALKSARGQQDQWRDWLAARLPEGLADHITQVVVGRNELTVCAATAGWAARLRYGLAEVEAQIRQRDAGIQRVQVKVLPIGSTG